MERKYSLICVKSLTTSSSMVGNRRIQFQNKFLNFLEDPVIPNVEIETNTLKDSKISKLRQSVNSVKKIKRKTQNTCLFCNKICASSWHLEIHMNKHTKEQPFACPDCDTTFSAQAGLRAHINSLHREKKFPCDMCPETFESYENMFAHRVKHFRKRSSTQHSHDEVTSSKRKGKPAAAVRTKQPIKVIKDTKLLLEETPRLKSIEKVESKNLNVNATDTNNDQDPNLTASGNEVADVTPFNHGHVNFQEHHEKEEKVKDEDELASTSTFCSTLSSPTSLSSNDLQVTPLQLNAPDLFVSPRQDVVDETVEDIVQHVGNKENASMTGLVSLESLLQKPGISSRVLPANAPSCRWSVDTIVTKPFPCLFCQTHFDKKKQLKNHLTSNHRMSLVVALINGRMDWIKTT